MAWFVSDKLNGDLLMYEAVFKHANKMVASKNTTDLVCTFTERLVYWTLYEVAVSEFSTATQVTTGAKRTFIWLCCLA